MPTMTIRKRMWEVLEVSRPGDRLSRTVDLLILSLIFLNILEVIVSSMQGVQRRHGRLLFGFEAVSVGVFTVEYLGRLWSCVTEQRYRGPIRGRLRYALTPMALIDLLAIIPFYLPFLGVDLRFLRVLRLMRVAKLFRYTESLRLISRVFQKRKEELLVTSMMMFLLIILSSCFLFFAEHDAQPEAYPDIPSTMWWAVVTLTTVGYGDVYPVTVMGRVIGAIVAVLGIGLVALPTGILGSGFVEELEARKRESAQRCPHCGERLDEPPVPSDQSSNVS